MTEEQKEILEKIVSKTPSRWFEESEERRIVLVRLNIGIIKKMISTYEFLEWSNTGEEKKDCKKILNALNKALLNQIENGKK